MPPRDDAVGASATPRLMRSGCCSKRQLLAQAIEADPDPDAFETWLLDRCLTRAEDVSMGALWAMAREVIAEWRLAAACPDFREWLAAGARSEDRG